jgi:hypothetical protein
MPAFKVYATSISIDSPVCADLLMVFARGSGQNKLTKTPSNVFTDTFKDAEGESHAFFSQIKTHLDVEYPHITYKPVSIHDFPGKYSDVGYRAVPIGVPKQIPNTVNAEVSWLHGGYRDSVEQGTIETVGYLKDQISSCPNQSIVVGGYSQGAQVMGDSLTRLTTTERNKILGASFFGDPKFIASHGDSLINPFDKATSFPWRRGDATNKDTGMLDPRVPYVPSDMEYKTTSYCYKSDLVCAGWTGFRGLEDKAHKGYSAEPMRNSVNELVQWAAPTLANIERSRGGLGATTGVPGTTNNPNHQPRDVMFLLNDDALATALSIFRYKTDTVLSNIMGGYPDTMFAVRGFGEDDNGSIFIPRFDNLQSFKYYTGYDINNPTFTSSNLTQSFAKQYPFGNQSMGGGDWADPHGLAVEKASFSSGWRPDAQKHIILMTDRPAKDDYSFNICHATVRSWLHVPNTDGLGACLTNAGATDIWPKSQHSEFCQTIYLAITSETCKNSIPSAGSVNLVHRNINDAIIAAQSQHIAVDVVIPNKITNQFHPELIPKMVADLEYLAKATGGIFIYYDQRDKYDVAAYSDTIFQVLNHTPKDIVITYKEALDGKESFNGGHVLAAKTNQPVILDASQSNTSFSQYKWDYNDDGTWDDTSPGPVIEHTFESPQNSVMRIAGLDEGQNVQAAASLAVNVTQADAPQTPTPPAIPEITVSTGTDGSIHLSWQSDQTGDLVVIDPDSHLPLVSAPLVDGTLEFSAQGQMPTTLNIRTIGESASQEQTLEIPPPAPVLVVTDDPGADEQAQADPTLCYKLQQCQKESDPEAQNITQTPTVANLAAVQRPVTASALQSQSQTPQVEGESTSREDVIAKNELVSGLEPKNTKGNPSKIGLFLGFATLTLLGGWLLYKRRAEA